MFLGYNFCIMKRYWPLLAIALILAAVIGMSQYADSAKHCYEESTRQAKAAAVTKSDDGKANNNAAESYKPPIWAKYVTWPEGVGAWAVILTLFVIAWQSVETRAAAQATQASAVAALLNAQAVINAERAWLTVTVADEFAPLPELDPNHYENERLQMKRVFAEQEEGGRTYRISFQNRGRTPAKIVGGDSCHRFIDLPDNLPVPVNYSCPIFLPDPTFIVNGDSFRIHPGFKPDFILERDRKRVNVGFSAEFLIFYGRIIYEDVFALPDGSSGRHETRWCFAYRPGEEKAFVACGPDEYSGHS
jgi:hypothetical protein